MPETVTGKIWEITGRIRSKELTENGTRCRLDIAEGCSEELPDLFIKGYSILISFDETSESIPHIGETITMELQLENYAKATNPGQFDLCGYYAIRGIDGYGRVQDGSRITENDRAYVTVSAAGWTGCLQERLFAIRIGLAQTLYDCLPEQEAGMLCAMLLGMRGEMDKDIRDSFARNGIAHILSISGLHIALLGQILYRLLRRIRLPRIPGAAVCALIMILYGLLTGMNTPTMRALLMFGMKLGAEVCGRTYDMPIGMAVSAMCILGENPRYLYDCGFLLSFTAVMGVAVIAPVLKLMWSYDGRICSALEMTLAIQLASLPVLAWFYYEIPLYAMLLNLIVIPLMTPIMILGVAGMLVGWFARSVGRILLWPERWLLGLQILVSRGMDRASGIDCPLLHPLIIGRPKLLQIAAYYALLALFLMLAVRWSKDGERGGIKKEKRVREKDVVSAGERRRKPGANMLLLLFPVAAVLCLIWRGRIPDQIWFLDVGQGDCICILGEDNQCTVIDCGSLNQNKPGENILIPFLKYMGISKVDRCMITHPDQDHMNGIVELLQQKDIGVRTVCMAEVFRNEYESAGCAEAGTLETAGAAKETSYGNNMADKEDTVDKRNLSGNEKWNILTEAVRKSGADILWLAAGDSILQGNWIYYVLHPDSGYSTGNSNDASLVVLATCDSFSVLLTGDLETTGEKCVMDEIGNVLPEKCSVDVLKIAHHGSRNTTTEAFLQAIRPGSALISCGKQNRYGHPHSETLERLKTVGTSIYRTDRYGAVIIEIKKDDVRVKGYVCP